MRHRSLFTLTLLCCVVLAGCGGTNAPVTETATNGTTVVTTTPTAESSVPTTDGPEETAAGGEDALVTVWEGSLPFDANVTYRRVGRLLGTETDEQVRVVVRESFGPGDQSTEPWGAFAADLGISETGTSVDGVPGVLRETGVYLYVDENDTAAEIERTLAHEFAHVLLGDPDPNVDAAAERTFDTRLASRSVLEGGAMYVETVYTDRYLPSVANETSILDRNYADAPGAVKLRWAPYRYGTRYVDRRVDSPRTVSTVYDDPPTSTEQVLHGDGQNTTLPRHPRVETTGTGTWQYTENTTRGELFTRIALGTELNRSVASVAAAGWNGDRVATLEATGGYEESYVWTLYWDSETDADEFEAAVEQYVDARETDDDAPAFRVERTSERSVTLFVGEESFVEGTSVRVDGRTVSVDVPEREE